MYNEIYIIYKFHFYLLPLKWMNFSTLFKLFEICICILESQIIHQNTFGFIISIILHIQHDGRYVMAMNIQLLGQGRECLC